MPAKGAPSAALEPGSAATCALLAGYREVARWVLPDRRVPVFAHVDTRPRQLTQHRVAAVIAAG